MRQLQTFTPDIKNIKWQNFNATYFDQTFLNELTWEDWEKEAIFIRDNVKDSDIELAFSRIPDNAKDDDWKQMLEYTKSRRDNMVKFARMAYELKSKQVDVVGTNKKDLFEVTRIDDQHTLVEAFELSKKGKKKESVYKRIFDHDITREVDIFGLGDDDQFVVTGDVKKSLKIRIIGGEGKDEINDSSSVSSGGKKTLYYDSSEEKTKLNVGKEFKDKRSNSTVLNTYDRRSPHYNPNYWIPLPVLSYNQDDKFIIGTNLSYFYQQYKKYPFGQKHNFELTYSIGTAAANFKYTGEYTDAIRGWDLVTNSALRRNRYAFNYFGFGNNSENLDPSNLDFNRVRQSRIYQDVLLRSKFNSTTWGFSFGPFIEQTRIQNTSDRFISDSEDILGQSVFDKKTYTGIKTKLEFQNVDKINDTKKGLKFNLSYDIETNLANSDLTFRRFGVGLIVYQPLDRKENFIFASSIGYEEVRGDFDFFKAPTIGGLTNLRGFRNERFRGESVFYHATDLRLKLVKTVNNVLPLSLGIHAGFDYGRVWDNESNSGGFHYSYGGGFYLNPLDLVVISFGQYWSEEDSRFILKFTHMF